MIKLLSGIVTGFVIYIVISMTIENRLMLKQIKRDIVKISCIQTTYVRTNDMTLIETPVVPTYNINVSKDDFDWSGIVVHHSESGLQTTTADINRWHLERGWDGIGYNFVILPDGTIDKGRPLNKAGAHAKGRNKTHIGICLVGRVEFTAAQQASLIVLVKALDKSYAINSVERHHEECPGPGIDINALNALVQ